jgi:hypothetical protein
VLGIWVCKDDSQAINKAFTKQLPPQAEGSYYMSC